MGLFDKVMGNASALTVAEAQESFGMLLADGEVIQQAFKGVRDCYLLTNTRFIFVDKQGVTGKRTAFMTIPYRQIQTFSVQTAGTMDDDTELFLTVAGHAVPITMSFSRGQDVFALQAALAQHLVRA